MQLAIPRTSPWSCSRGINHGCAAAALGAPSLLGRWLQLLLLSLICPPRHEPCSSSSSHTAGVCAALGMQVIPAGRVLCAVPLAGEPGEDRWVTLPCKAFPEVLAVLPSAWHWDAQPGAAQLPVLAHPCGSAPAKLPVRLLFSRAGCAPRAPPAQGLPRHLRPKIPVKSPCYLLSSVVFAADAILYLFFLWECCILTP